MSEIIIFKDNEFKSLSLENKLKLLQEKEIKIKNKIKILNFKKEEINKIKEKINFLNNSLLSDDEIKQIKLEINNEPK